MRKKTQTRKPQRNFHSKKNELKEFAFKAAIRLVLVASFCLIIYSIKSGITHLFFSSNPHFTLKHIDIEIVKGVLTEQDITNQLKLKVGETNLFSIDPGMLRNRILEDTLVQELEVRRLLPNRLSLIVYGRTPIAQIISRGGYLVDADGIILRSNQKSEIKKLPIITGIPGIKNYKIGQELDHAFVLKAIEFLKLKEVITNGTWLDVHLIQLNENHSEFRVYLNQNKNRFIREGAQLILPIDHTKEAVMRAISILEHRVQARQPTSFIDATYEKRVPVRP